MILKCTQTPQSHLPHGAALLLFYLIGHASASHVFPVIRATYRPHVAHDVGGPRVRGAALKLRRRLNPSVPITHEPTTILSPTVMSQTHPLVTSSSNFQSIFDNALKAYRKRTKKDLLNHPLATQLQQCDSPSSIRAVLRRQVQEIDQSQTDDRLTRWLDPTVNVLSALSNTIGDAVGLVCSHT